MLKPFLAVLVIAFSFCTPAARREPQKIAPRERPPSDTTADRYAVYSALLKARAADPPAKLLVIQDETEDDTTDQTDDRWDNLKKALDPDSQSMVDDYKVKNLQPSAIENRFSVPEKVILVSKEEVDRYFSEGGGDWEAFYKHHPNSGGLIRLSNVGFSPEMNQALVYVAFGCGGLCGSGGMVLMTKKNGDWTVKTTLSVWVS